MSEDVILRIKAYLIRMDIDSEMEVKSAEDSYRGCPCAYSAARLLASQQHRRAIHKMLCDLWELLDHSH